MNESCSDDDTGTKVFGKVEDLAVDREARYTPCEDREEGDGGGRCPNDEDGTDTETGGATAVIDGPGALDLISHVVERRNTMRRSLVCGNEGDTERSEYNKRSLSYIGATVRG